jgi:replicative DNA helicase
LSFASKSLGALFFASVVKSTAPYNYLQMGVSAKLFTTDAELGLFKFFDEHVRKHATLPAAETIAAHTGVKLPDVKEPPSYYLEGLQRRYTEDSVERTMTAVSETLTEQGASGAQTALDILRVTVREHDMVQAGRAMTDLRETLALGYDQYLRIEAGEAFEGAVRTSWPTLDNSARGFSQGDLIGICARPGIGKSWMLLWVALSAWQDGKTVLFGSMEMSIDIVRERVLAMVAELPYTKLQQGKLDAEYKARAVNALGTVSQLAHGFYVVDGNLSAQVTDMEVIARQVGADAIYVDGAYLLKHPTERDRYRRVAENVDLIKQRLCAIAPTFTTWQLKRQESKKEKSVDDFDLEDIAYADAIGQACSVVLAIFDENEGDIDYGDDDSDCIRTIRVLKGRSGEMGKFNVYWRFKKTTNFDEVPSADVSLTT